MNNPHQSIWTDERPFQKRLLLALLASFSVAFTFVIMGVLDLYMNNIGMFPFSIGTLIGPVLLVAFGIIVVLTAICCLLKGRVFDLMLSLLIGLLLAGYLQGMFLNLNLGELTGDPIDWEQYVVHGYINTFVWVLFLIAPILVRRLWPKVWSKLTIILPAIVVGMQLVGLSTTALQTDFTAINEIGRPTTQYLSEKGIFELSSQKNVLVFVMDRMDAKYIDEVKQSDPTFFDDLAGFTYYNNYTSLYCRTFPAVVNMLTGAVYYNDYPVEDFMAEAYEQSTFLPDLRENNYTTKLYISDHYTYSDINQLVGLADNILTDPNQIAIDQTVMMRRMLRFSDFRYAPHVLKQFFWMTPEAFFDLVIDLREIPSFNTDLYRFDEDMKQTEMTLQDEKNNFMYLHLKGCHPEFDLNEMGEHIGAANSDMLAQTKGYFHLIKQYMQKMKELGVYDNSTILILGDHGKSEDFESPSTYKTTGLFVKPADAGNGPLQISSKSVSQRNFQATILEEAGISSDSYDPSIWAIADDDDSPRQLLYKIDDECLQEFEIYGDANDFANWSIVNEHPLTFDLR